MASSSSSSSSSSKPVYNRILIKDLLNETPSRGRTSRRSTRVDKPDIFEIECDAPNCSRKFVSREAAEAHKRRVHPQPTTFICYYCQSSFSTAPNLNKHIRSVHGRHKPFKCQQCSSAFGFKDGLQRHMDMVHDKIRPYPCAHCALKFKTKAHLNKHSLSLHPEAHCSDESQSASNSRCVHVSHSDATSDKSQQTRSPLPNNAQYTLNINSNSDINNQSISTRSEPRRSPEHSHMPSTLPIGY